MKRLLLLALLFLAACGGGAPATVAIPQPTATATPPAQLDAVKVADAFNKAGLRADAPYLAPETAFKDAPKGGAAFHLWKPESNGAVIPMMSVIVAGSPDQLIPWQNYFYDRSRGVFLRYRYLIRHNVMLVFTDTVTQNNSTLPDWSQYWAVFAALP